jgi:hypothetical protein
MAEEYDPVWIARSSVKLFLELRHLSELELLVETYDMSRIFECFSKLHNLCKLKIKVRCFIVPNAVNDLGKVIGANLNLTHLELVNHLGFEGNLSTIFGHVPTSSPLKLEHLGISYGFSNVTAIIPHIRSLTSVQLSFQDDMLTVLHSERIFPPIIKTARVNSQLIDYLRQHPRIVSLSIPTNYEEIMGRTIFGIMAHHSDSLTYFSTTPSGLFSCLEHVECNFLQLVKLEQLVLYYVSTSLQDRYSGTDMAVPGKLVSRQFFRVYFDFGVLKIHVAGGSIINYCLSTKFIDSGDQQPGCSERMH